METAWAAVEPSVKTAPAVKTCMAVETPAAMESAAVEASSAMAVAESRRRCACQGHRENRDECRNELHDLLLL